LDVAIQGAGYFSVQTPNGDTRYTRNGVFQINDGGQLVDLNGNAVQGSSGEINIPKGTTSITIGQDGTVSTPKAILGQIGLTTFANEQSLQPDGNNYLTASADADPQPATNPRMLQGSIESSNVNTVKSMTQMIEVQRQYQSAANLVQQEQDRTTNAIKDLAKIN
jgi:flagellar basal-body rod protein FlgF